ncbi:hypothetical protein Cgig2_032821 [Carnegiea gigantea]|uniref:Uncharacterized protein n=1 Tax=Carnegiea gigantea TaxID=171969 RepID=A0A9Q1JS06_9CARY|nr:hypothetical protein Cgig2_032821 [Carnegiea gigantea]
MSAVWWNCASMAIAGHIAVVVVDQTQVPDNSRIFVLGELGFYTFYFPAPSKVGAVREADSQNSSFPLQVFQKRLPPEAVDLICRFFQYSPSLRCTALEACVHPFFDELRDPNTRLPNGRPLPPLFNFKPQELLGIPPDMVNRLIPEHARRQNLFMALNS